MIFTYSECGGGMGKKYWGCIAASHGLIIIESLEWRSESERERKG